MLLDLMRAIQAESVGRLPLQALVDEVGSFDGPALGDLVTSDLHLLGKNVISDFFPGLPIIGSLKSVRPLALTLPSMNS